jgi:glucose repression mediator protein
MTTNNFGKAYEAYQQAVYRDGKNPAFWCSIGVLYYKINQFHDALDAYSRAIRIHPYLAEVWFNLGALYESCNDQIADAIDAYQRTQQLDPSHTIVGSRLREIREHQLSGASLSAPPRPEDISPSSLSWNYASNTVGTSTAPQPPFGSEFSPDLSRNGAASPANGHVSEGSPAQLRRPPSSEPPFRSEVDRRRSSAEHSPRPLQCNGPTPVQPYVSSIKSLYDHPSTPTLPRSSSDQHRNRSPPSPRNRHAGGDAGDPAYPVPNPLLRGDSNGSAGYRGGAGVGHGQMGEMEQSERDRERARGSMGGQSGGQQREHHQQLQHRDHQYGGPQQHQQQQQQSSHHHHHQQSQQQQQQRDRQQEQQRQQDQQQQQQRQRSPPGSSHSRDSYHNGPPNVNFPMAPSQQLPPTQQQQQQLQQQQQPFYDRHSSSNGSSRPSISDGWDPRSSSHPSPYSVLASPYVPQVPTSYSSSAVPGYVAPPNRRYDPVHRSQDRPADDQTRHRSGPPAGLPAGGEGSPRVEAGRPSTGNGNPEARAAPQVAKDVKSRSKSPKVTKKESPAVASATKGRKKEVGDAPPKRERKRPSAAAKKDDGTPALAKRSRAKATTAAAVIASSAVDPTTSSAQNSSPSSSTSTASSQIPAVVAAAAVLSREVDEDYDEGVDALMGLAASASNGTTSPRVDEVPAKEAEAAVVEVVEDASKKRALEEVEEEVREPKRKRSTGDAKVLAPPILDAAPSVPVAPVVEPTPVAAEAAPVVAEKLVEVKLSEAVASGVTEAPAEEAPEEGELPAEGETVSAA